jgi:hypothetical protein
MGRMIHYRARMLPPYLAARALLVFASQELDLSYTSAGVLATGCFHADAAMQLPAGVVGEPPQGSLAASPRPAGAARL